MQPAVFLDRDGTMIHEVNYLARREDLRWFSWTKDAIRLLNRAGYLVFVVTNQSGVGLGYYPEQFVVDTHAYMAAELERSGARVDGWFHCPHHPRATVAGLRLECTCRKPGRGMIDQAASAHDIDLARSFVVGDKHLDVALAATCGGRGILVRTGHGEDELARMGNVMPGAAFVAAELMEATSWILRAG
ncbi:MAG: HAD family hydrolase [Acidobacteriota bacterium]